MEGVLRMIGLMLFKSASPPSPSYFHVSIFKTANVLSNNTLLALEPPFLQQRGDLILACHSTAHRRAKCSRLYTLLVVPRGGREKSSLGR